MQFKQMFRGNSWKLAAASVVAVGLAVGGLTAAQAAGNPGIQDRSIYHIDIAKGAVGADTIGNRSVQSYHLNKDLVSALLAVPANGVDSSKVKDGTLTEADLSAELKTKVNQVGTGEQGPQGPKGDTGPQGPQGEPGAKGAPGDPATDVKGSTASKAVYNNKVIENVGGSWLTRKTDLGTFTLPAGTWVIHTSAKFTRLADDATPQYQTRPQLAVRAFATDQNRFGLDFGTVMNTIAPFKDADMFGSDTHRVVLTDTTTFTVAAFGYQDDRGSDDSGKIQVTKAEIFVSQG